MKPLRHCSDAELQTRCAWSCRLVLGLFASVVIGYGLAFVWALSDPGGDHPTLWVLLVGIALACTGVYLYHTRVSMELVHRTRQKVRAIIVLLDKVPPDSDPPYPE